MMETNGERGERRTGLSVIVPCLNAEATLSVQLEALAAQQWSEPWEFILSDNGSTDRSVEIARCYKERLPYFKIVDASERKGGSYAINRAARFIRFDKFVVCDADDEVSPGWVAAMGEALMAHDVVCGQFRFDKFNEPAVALHTANLWKDGLYKGNFLPGGGSGNFGIHRSVHELIGGFDERLFHAYDADYFWRLQLEGFKLHYHPAAVVQVRLGRVNPSLSSLYRRAKVRAASNYWTYKRYRHLGMLPPKSLKRSMQDWFRVLKGSAHNALRGKEGRIVWLRQFAGQTGEVVGQLLGKTRNPFTPYQPGKRRVT